MLPVWWYPLSRTTLRAHAYIPVQSVESLELPRLREPPPITCLTYYAEHYTISIMIKSFRCKDTEALYKGESPKRFRAIETVAVRKLQMLEAAHQLRDLRSPPGNRLEPMHWDRPDQHSIRINGQWRLCFVWANDGVTEVEIVDYH